MTTAREIISGALERIRAYAGGESPSAEDADRSLVALNRMLFAWELDGIALGHTELALDDVLNVPDTHLEPIEDNLAVKLWGLFWDDSARPVPSALKSDADDGKSLLRGLYLDMDPLTIDRSLIPRRWWGLYNWQRGY